MYSTTHGQSHVATALQSLLDRQAARKNIHSILLSVHSGDGRINFDGAAGNTNVDQPFFMASITKMFTAAVLLQLVDDGYVDLDDTIASHLPLIDLAGIHVWKGEDYSERLTLRHLLHQTSGLADYFEGDFVEALERGKDLEYSLHDVLRMVRAKKPSAAPETGKSHYSDTNFQLLGAVIETVTGKSLQSVFSERIFTPLGMKDTYLFDHIQSAARKPIVPLYYDDKKLNLSGALSCMGPDGGGVWTLRDGIRFLRAYFAGELFSTSHLVSARQWNSAFFPVQYGYGVMRFKLPRWMALFRETTEFLGHSGVTGAWAFYAPKEDLFLVGSVSQLDARQFPYRFMPQVVDTIKKLG